MTEIIGIDLGTTNSCAAIWQDGGPKIIPNSEGFPITPSVIAVDPITKELIVGQRARAIAEEDPHSVVYSIKRIMGRRFREEVVQSEIRQSRILYEIEESRRWQDGIEVAFGDRHLTPQEVSAKILQKIKIDAEAYLGHRITQAVITVPAYFHDSQRQATRDAGRIAGFEVKRVLNEPTAACLAFGYKKVAEKRKTIAVYDLGGGTFDISVLQVGQGPFRVRATNGDTHLGGDDIDWAIVDWILKEIGSEEKNKIQENIVALARLRAAAERAKMALSEVDEVHLQIPDLFDTSAVKHDLDISLSRAKLEELVEPTIARTLETCARALQDAKLTASAIEEVLLVGGQSRMPAIRRAIQDFFGIPPNVSANPEEVVALGAAVQAAILSGENTKLILADVVPLSLGVSARGLMDALILRNTAVPVIKKKVYSTASDNQESVEIQVFQGERPLVSNNTKLGAFILKGLEPAAHGEPEIEVTFRVDQDSILHISAKDMRTGNFKEITITDSIRLSEEEIATMICDAEEHAAEYAAQRQQAESQIQAEQLMERLTQLITGKEASLPHDLLIHVRTAIETTTVSDWNLKLLELQDLWSQITASFGAARADSSQQ